MIYIQNVFLTSNSEPCFSANGAVWIGHEFTDVRPAGVHLRVINLQVRALEFISVARLSEKLKRERVTVMVGSFRHVEHHQLYARL